MKLYMWYSEALGDYDNGSIIVIGNSEEDARKRAKENIQKAIDDSEDGKFGLFHDDSYFSFESLALILDELNSHPDIVTDLILLYGGP